MSKKIIRWILIAICFTIIICESYALYNDHKQDREAGEEYIEILSNSVSQIPNQELAEIIEYPVLSINYDKLKSINSDFVAWLYFPCFDISYPVVKEHTIDEYLYTTFEGNQNKSGCLYSDVLSASDFRGMHDMIFGHNMRNGTMFGQFKLLNKPEYQEQLATKPYIYVYTPKYVFQYKVFAYYNTTVGSEAYAEVTTDQEYDDLISYISTKSAVAMPKDVDFTSHNSLLTLSTCSGSNGSRRRFVIHTVKTNAWDVAGS